MTAIRQNLVIEQGASFKFNIDWIQKDAVTPVDLTGFTARMHVRSDIDAIDPPLIIFTTENGRITLGGSAGTIQLDMTATDTAALSFTTGVYDLELVDTGGDGKVTRIIYGGVEVRPEVTR